MHKIIIIGAGKIGSLIAGLLAESGDYEIHLADLSFTPTHAKLVGSRENVHMVEMDVSEHQEFHQYLTEHKLDALISCLPYFLNKHATHLAKEFGLHYFDLTEDTTSAELVREVAREATSAFVPQCGLAPGFVGIVANNLMQQFDTLETAHLRVGALPVNSNRVLHYALMWSTDGLINEYGNVCSAIQDGKFILLEPLEDVETIHIDGLAYEAFNTSGGLGYLAELYAGKIKTLDYKTIRYPGHCEKVRFLMKDLQLNLDRETLKKILESVLPKVSQDVVTIYVSVSGSKNDQYVEKSFLKKIYPKIICGQKWAAIQVSTAAGVCSVLDIVLSKPDVYTGLVFQEKIELDDVLNNRFGQYFN